jgi:hypothetical protein
MSDDEARPTPPGGAAVPPSMSSDPLSAAPSEPPSAAPSDPPSAAPSEPRSAKPSEAPPVVPSAMPPVAPPVAPEVMEGIRSLHERLDELQRLVAGRLDPENVHTAGEWLQARADTAVHAARAVPAWQRRTQGELRWPVTLTTAVAVGLQMAVPDRLVLVRPSWVLPAVQGVLLVILLIANPRRIDNESKAIRWLALTFAALLSLSNLWSLARLAIGITQGSTGTTPAHLLITGALIWLTNVIVFGLWYWEFDRGGPVARALNTKQYPDFQFVQMVSPPVMVPPDWEPHFVDYLYLGFTNAAAFSPTDVMPLSRWAKIAMTAQSAISIVTVALVVSRAVNILT